MKGIGSKPKLYYQSVNTLDNQQIYYSTVRYERIEKQLASQKQHNNHVANELSNQRKATSDLKLKNESVLKMINEKEDTVQDIVNTLSIYGEDIENIKQDMGELDQLNDRVIQQTMLTNDISQEQENHREQLYDLSQQLQLRDVDHDDLLDKVKEQGRQQQVIEDRVNQLVEKIEAVTVEHRNQEQLYLELYTEFIKLKAYTAEATKHWKRYVSKVNETKKHELANE